METRTYQYSNYAPSRIHGMDRKGGKPNFYIDAIVTCKNPPRAWFPVAAPQAAGIYVASARRHICHARSNMAKMALLYFVMMGPRIYH